ncbi:hypothetical protein BDQ12DRAFT_703695 [Crucibulum laeve]|uniref:MYND-type domain-containing protein n=1 Tax=Crucibulum laeve TaxID=68775 RepID=A0A5C3M8D2_9AGAR|nr:hypothetical protein BDQ12DRAFT_703695 [Crucibulum laeve]
MPGPGNRAKSKIKPKPKHTTTSSSSTTDSTPEAYIGDIDNAAGWKMIVNILCEIFELPDLTKRSGLKKVHANFDYIYRKIDKAYQRNLNNDRIRGGIIGIYAKMSADSLLRNKLFERGLLDKIMPLIDVPYCRHLALQALGTVTHHGGEDIRVSELCVATLGHCVSAVVEGGPTPAQPKVLGTLDMPTILKVVASSYTIDHAMDLLAMCTLHAYDAFNKYPAATDLLVAGLRSKDWVCCCTSLGGLIRLHRHKAENDLRMMDPNKFMTAVQRRFPDHITDDFQNAMISAAQDHDLYALGLKLTEYILSANLHTGKLENMNVGLPFTMWAKKKASEADLADILDIKYEIMRHCIPKAVEIVKKGIQRNPDYVYFYYAITLAANNIQGLRAAKQGLKCKQMTPFVDMGIKILQENRNAGNQQWEEGIAFLMSALEDSKTMDLHKLQDAFTKLKITDKISHFIGVPPPLTNLRLAQELIVQCYADAVKKFSEVITKVDNGPKPPTATPTPQKLKDNLTMWLENMSFEGDEEQKVHCSHPKISTNHCLWCGNLSAVLRKCSGCAKTRYCDSGCQKAHWGTHKKLCKACQ